MIELHCTHNRSLAWRRSSTNLSSRRLLIGNDEIRKVSVKKSKVMILLVLVLYLNTACGSTNLTNADFDESTKGLIQPITEEDSNIADYNDMDTNNESIEKLELSEESHIFLKDDGSSYNINYVQVSGLEDVKHVEKINSSLRNAMIEWANDYSEWAEGIQLNYQYMNDKFLSVLYVGEFESPIKNDYNVDYIQIGIIIDLETGERVFLNDVIGNKPLKTQLLEYRVDNGIDSIITEEEADNMIRYASISEKRYIDEMLKSDAKAKKYMMSYLMSKPTIFLKEGVIVITRGEGLLGDVILNSNEWLELR